MDPHSTWVFRDIIFLATIIFNAGGLVYMFFNHQRHSSKNFKDIFKRLRDLEKSVAWIRGKMNGE